MSYKKKLIRSTAVPDGLSLFEQMNKLVFLKNDKPLTTSLIIAEGTENEHRSIIRLIQNYEKQFERWGKVRFVDKETAYAFFGIGDNDTRRLSTDRRGGRPMKVALLNEQQATLLLLLIANNEATIEFKMNLVDRFYEFNGTHAALKDWIENTTSDTRSTDPTKCVYVIQTDNNRVKIGRTNNFKRRMNAIRTTSGLNIVRWCHTDYLTKSYSYEVESACHAAFKSQRIMGEFFSTSYEDVCAELEKYAAIVERQ